MGERGKSRHEITIVTAFFNIGRESWGNFARDNKKYIEYFRFWARIQNKVIIYTDPGMADAIREVRKDFHREDRTEIIVIDDVTQFDLKVFQAMEKALAHPLAVKFRSMPNNPESHNAYYNYIMYMKSLLVQDAIRRGLATGMVAWLDFGYNHGGQYYIRPEEFDFLWTTDMPDDKIHMFNINEIDDTPIFEIVRNMEVYIIGTLLLGNYILWDEMVRLCREAVLALAMCGFSDDDQTVNLMIYRKNPDLFILHKVDNFIESFGKTTEHKFTIAQQRILEHKLSKKYAKDAWKKKQYVCGIKWYGKYVIQKIMGK